MRTRQSTPLIKRAGISAETMHDNVLRVWATMPPLVRIDGMQWYERAHAWLAALAGDYGLTLPVLAAAVAVNSPRCRWEHQRSELPAQLDAILAGSPRIPGHGLHRERMRQVILTRDLGLLSGPKVLDFYMALMGRLDACPIDTWMAAVCLAHRLHRRERLTCSDYTAMRAAVVTAAHEVGIPPAPFQGAVWVAVQSGAVLVASSQRVTLAA